MESIELRPLATYTNKHLELLSQVANRHSVWQKKTRGCEEAVTRSLWDVQFMDEFAYSSLGALMS